MGHKSPRLASRLRLLEQIPKPIDEVAAVGVIFENRPALDYTNDNVLQEKHRGQAYTFDKLMLV
jgi:hypothetical protein